MYTYHVYFNIKADVTDADLAAAFSKFVRSETERNRLAAYSLTRFENKASFPDLPDYHFAARYHSKDDQAKAMADMSTRFNQEPHLSLMKITSDFRVAFSREVEVAADKPQKM